MRMISIARLVLVLATLLPRLVLGQIFVPDEKFIPNQPMPWMPVPYHWAPIEVAETKITAKIRDSIAITTVDEQLYNPNSQQMEGTFLFPVPRGAQLDKFTMDIDGKPVDAELLNADKARGIYEDIVRRLKDPALLEYAGRDLLKIRIFPIPGNSRKHVTFSYTQVLKTDSGLVSYVFPLNTEKFSAKPLKNVSVKIELTSAQPLKSIYSPSHTVEIRRDQSRRATIGFEATETRPDTDFEVLFMPEKGEIGASLMTYKTGDEDGYFLLLASPGVDVKNEKIVPKDVVFVLDTSGSMAGNKLTQAKKAFQFCVENLNEQDRFELIRFSTDIEPLFHSLVDASASNRQRATDFIKNLKPTGSTDLNEALRQSLALRPAGSERPYVVIFLTDGLPTIGETDNEKIIAHVKEAGAGHARVFCFGLGTDVNAHLLDRIAEDTGAFGQYVLPDEDIETKVSNFYTKIKEPILANPTLQFPGSIEAKQLYPSPLPDLFKGDQLIVVGRYKGAGSGEIQLDGKVSGSTRKFQYPAQFARSDTEHDFIPKLWATRRVGYLLDQIRLHGETSETRDEATELARKYGIVTPFTAYLIVEDEKRREVPVAMRSLQQLDKDKGARDQGKLLYDNFQKQETGDMAVQSSRYGRALGSANNLAAAKSESSAVAGAMMPSSPALTGGYKLSAPASSVQTEGNFSARLDQSARQTRFVGGRNFFQNGAQWTDAGVQKLQTQKPIRIQFNSKEYFAFSAKNPRALPWLALGSNVQFVLDNALYEIYD